MTTGGVIYFLFSESVIRIFTADAAVIDHGTGALKALAVSLPFWTFWTVYGGSLRGLGDARTPMIASSVSMWLAVALAWAAVVFLDGSLTMVWATFLVTSPIAAVVNTLWFGRRLHGVREDIAAGLPPPAPA
jgi:Na+-driven multidrug efflux pump